MVLSSRRNWSSQEPSTLHYWPWLADRHLCEAGTATTDDGPSRKGRARTGVGRQLAGERPTNGLAGPRDCSPRARSLVTWAEAQFG
jgi:hypothetical protein